MAPHAPRSTSKAQCSLTALLSPGLIFCRLQMKAWGWGAYTDACLGIDGSGQVIINIPPGSNVLSVAEGRSSAL